MKERFIVQTSTPERKFVKVYFDFLNSGILSGKEQIIFIHLKQYINFASDGGIVRGEVYPTLATLAKNVKMSEKTVRTVLQSLQKKGILTIKQRGLNRPNIYKINDSAAMWKSGNVEELKAAVDEIEEKHMIEVLTAKGYYISKEKGLDSEPTKAHYQAPENNNSYADKNTINEAKSQVERYSAEDLKVLYDYSDLVTRFPDKQTDIDIILGILHDALNTSKKVIRVGGEDKPVMVVSGRLLKLQADDLIHVIEQFHEQKSKIKNPKNYLLTALYNGHDQAYLDMMNEGHVRGDF